MKELENDPSVIFIMQRFFEGDKVLQYMIGNEKQVLARIYVVTKTKKDLFLKIDEIKSSLSVLDENGNDMIVDLLNTSYL